MTAFWPANIAAWFASGEGVFELRGIIKGGRSSDLPRPIPIFRLNRLIFFMDFNTSTIDSSLQNEDL
jgi:hypothetical protein